MRILFIGTPDFAAVHLKRLIDEGREVVGVVSQPDRPRGRGYVMTPPPVKVCASDAGIRVYQPERIRDGELLPVLEETSPDIIVVVAYGKILPTYVLNYARFGCINVHGSLLPKYRGAAPMQRAIMEGESQTGITTQYMAEGIDTGDILLREVVPILDTDNFETIHDKMAEVGARLLCKTIDGIADGSITPVPQNNDEATYAAKITKEECLLDFSLPAKTVCAKIRGLSPAPLSYTILPSGKTLKIVSASVTDGKGEAGVVLSVSGKGDGEIVIACGDGAISVTAVVPEGRGKMSAGEFVRGRKISENERLG